MRFILYSKMKKGYIPEIPEKYVRAAAAFAVAVVPGVMTCTFIYYGGKYFARHAGKIAAELARRQREGDLIDMLVLRKSKKEDKGRCRKQ